MHQTENRSCQNCKKNFTIEPEDFGFYEKISVQRRIRLRRGGVIGFSKIFVKASSSSVHQAELGPPAS